MLTSGCEEIRTREDGIFNEFYAKFNDIVNLSFLPSKKLGLQFFEIHQWDIDNEVNLSWLEERLHGRFRQNCHLWDQRPGPWSLGSQRFWWRIPQYGRDRTWAHPLSHSLAFSQDGFYFFVTKKLLRPKWRDPETHVAKLEPYVLQLSELELGWWWRHWFYRFSN